MIYLTSSVLNQNTKSSRPTSKPSKHFGFITLRVKEDAFWVLLQNALQKFSEVWQKKFAQSFILSKLGRLISSSQERFQPMFFLATSSTNLKIQTI
jgi:hypothetical protein